MTRSRTILLLAWGLLAVGGLFQLVRPDNSSQSAEEDPTLAYSDADDQETPGRRSTGQGDSNDTNGSDADSGADSTPGVGTAGDMPGRGRSLAAEPPEQEVQIELGGDRVFLVLDQTTSDDYVKVSLPVMPNGQEGWIARSEVEITKIEHRALIDLSAHSVTVWDGDGEVTSTKMRVYSANP